VLVLVLAGCAPEPAPAPTPAGPKPLTACLSRPDDTAFATCVQAELDAAWGREFRDTGRIYTPPRLTVDAAAPSDNSSPPRDGRGQRTDSDEPDRAYFAPQSGGEIHFPAAYLAAVHAAHGPLAHLVLTFTMGHEFGHHVQFLLHPRTEVRVNELESQADCYAGIWARQEADAGGLDIGQFRASAAAELHRLSSYHNEVDTHGGPDQRLASLDRGLHGDSPASCDQGELTWLPRPSNRRHPLSS
jgi:predicted metalloprotease